MCKRPWMRSCLVTFCMLTVISLLLTGGATYGQSQLPTSTPEAEIPSETVIPSSTPGSVKQLMIGTNRGRVTGGGSETWEYVARVGELLTIEVEPDAALDPMLTLYNPENEELAFDDDIIPDVDVGSRIEELLIPATGTYRIEVGSWEDSPGGSYTITLTTIMPVIPTSNPTTLPDDASSTVVPGPQPGPTVTPTVVPIILHTVTIMNNTDCSLYATMGTTAFMIPGNSITTASVQPGKYRLLGEGVSPTRGKCHTDPVCPPYNVEDNLTIPLNWGTCP